MHWQNNIMFSKTFFGNNTYNFLSYFIGPYLVHAQTQDEMKYSNMTLMIQSNVGNDIIFHMFWFIYYTNLHISLKKISDPIPTPQDILNPIK